MSDADPRIEIETMLYDLHTAIDDLDRMQREAKTRGLLHLYAKDIEDAADKLSMQVISICNRQSEKVA